MNGQGSRLRKEALDLTSQLADVTAGAASHKQELEREIQSLQGQLASEQGAAGSARQTLQSLQSEWSAAVREHVLLWTCPSVRMCPCLPPPLYARTLPSPLAHDGCRSCGQRTDLESQVESLNGRVASLQAAAAESERQHRDDIATLEYVRSQLMMQLDRSHLQFVQVAGQAHGAD